MPKSRNDKLQGTLTLLVLRTLNSRGPMHGYGLCSHIHSVSDELVQVEEGSLYRRCIAWSRMGGSLRRGKSLTRGAMQRYTPLRRVGESN
jgi:hypothetical protein